MYEKAWPSLWTALLLIRTACNAIIESLLKRKFIRQGRQHLRVAQQYNTEEHGNLKILSRDNYGDSQEFLNRVEEAFCGPLRDKLLLKISSGLKSQYYERLQDPNCMLPSFNHQLPCGRECGKFIALDLGGSNFRVALVQLCGKSCGGQESKILKMKAFKITSDVKDLSGHLFFDWMADKIKETLLEQELTSTSFPIGVSWSFPIEQTSHRSGRLMKMGKGFFATEGLLKQDLGDLIQESCRNRGLNVHLDAIINDSSASLLSKAYVDTATRFALILGTGVNAAVHLPVHLFSPSKIGVRSPDWHASAHHVIVNTEMSMMGKDLLPATEWDKKLRADHPNPDFQPFEHFVGGRYLGEIVRLILVDGIETAGLFGGIVPPSLKEKYSLETETISQIECDQSPNLTNSYRILCERHPLIIAPTARDILALRFISSRVIYRASGLVAAGLHALWELRNEVDPAAVQSYSQTQVACNGSVIENYPGFKNDCQKHLDSLVQASGGKKGMVRLVFAQESSLLGAAVASAVAS